MMKTSASRTFSSDHLDRADHASSWRMNRVRAGQDGPRGRQSTTGPSLSHAVPFRDRHGLETTQSRGLMRKPRDAWRGDLEQTLRAEEDHPVWRSQSATACSAKTRHPAGVGNHTCSRN